MDKKKDLIRRLKIIQGQIGGVIRMLEAEEDCHKILTQLKAAKSAFHATGEDIVKTSLKECVGTRPLGGVAEKKFDEILKIFSRF